MATKSSTTKADFLRHLLMTLLNFSSFWVILVNVAHCLEVRKWFTNGTHGGISQIYAGFKFMPNSYFGTLFKGSLHSNTWFPFNIAALFFLKAFLRIAWLLLDLGQLFDACIGLLIFLRLIKATSLFRPFWPSLSWRLFTFTLRTRGYSTLFSFAIKHQKIWKKTYFCCIVIYLLEFKPLFLTQFSALKTYR